MAVGQKKQIQSIIKANAIISLLSKEGRPMSLSEISQALKWPKSTIHGLLSTLMEISFVEQSQENGQYFLGIRMFELGCSVSNMWGIRIKASPHLQNLAHTTNESSYLAVPKDTDAIILDTVTANHIYRFAPLLGNRSPLFCTSFGKVLLAYQPPKLYARTVKKINFTRFTPYTISNVESLERALGSIRQNGYCIEHNEHYIGISSISSPVFDHAGTVKYAVGIVGTFSNASNTSLSAMVSQVCTTAENLSSELGWQKPL